MKNNKENRKEFEGYENLPAACINDCTGLTPTPATNKAEHDSYEELYPFLPQIPTREDDEEWVE